MNKIKLTKYEKDILNEYKKGNFKQVDNFDQLKKELEEAAINTLKKDKNINLRLSTNDLMRIKSKAVKSGLPYQTLISTILHQYASGKLVINL